MSKRPSNFRDVPIVEKLYRQNQTSYASAGGFLDDDDDAAERQRQRDENRKNAEEAASSSNITPAPDSCVKCSKALIDSLLWDKFNEPVCDGCRAPDGEHKLITRTEAKTQYLLKDCDFDMRKPPLKFISKKNPHNPRYGDMKLYLKGQIEARVLEVFGSWEALEEAKEQRVEMREVRRDKRFEKKIKELRNEVRGDSKNKAAKRKSHEHTYGEEQHDSSSDEYFKICTHCSYRLSYEKM
uniref:XPA C-terminal domain-containing protein n=1 Tax=Plectus sambesii TaxID=2011161 RepID=A0A914WSX8_9BILA